jgi:hypothetical protein
MIAVSAIPASRAQTSPAAPPGLLDVRHQAAAERGHSVKTIRVWGLDHAVHLVPRLPASTRLDEHRSRPLSWARGPDGQGRRKRAPPPQNSWVGIVSPPIGCSPYLGVS